MTIADTDFAATDATDAAPTHPLASLTAPEFTRIRDIVSAAPDFTPTTRFAYVGLDEPHKREVLAWQDGEGPLPERRALRPQAGDGDGQPLCAGFRFRRRPRWLPRKRTQPRWPA